MAAFREVSPAYEKMCSEIVKAGGPKPIRTGLCEELVEERDAIEQFVGCGISCRPWIGIMLKYAPLLKREHAELGMTIRAMTEKGLTEATPFLLSLFNHDSEPWEACLWEACLALSSINDPTSYDRILGICGDKHYGKERGYLVWNLLPRMKRPEVYPLLVKLLKDEDIKWDAASALASLGDPRGLPLLESLPVEKGEDRDRQKLVDRLKRRIERDRAGAEKKAKKEKTSEKPRPADKRADAGWKRISFKLRFVRRAPTKPPTRTEVLRGLRGVRYLNAAQSTGPALRFVYQQPDTKVSFRLDFRSSPASSKAPAQPAGFTDSGLSAVIPLGRASFFAREAMPVIERVCRRLRLLVLNTEEDGPPKKARVETLVQDWNKANEFAVKARSLVGLPAVISPESADYWWRYQYQQEDLQQRLGPGIFVPTLAYVRRISDGRLFSMISWPDAIPIVLPECDLAFLGKNVDGDEEPKGPQETGGILFSKLLKKIKPFTKSLPGSAVRTLVVRERTKELRRVFNAFKLEPFEGKYHVVDPKDVLDGSASVNKRHAPSR